MAICPRVIKQKAKTHLPGVIRGARKEQAKPVNTTIKDKKVDHVLLNYEDSIDAYTKAHLKDVSTQIQKALEAQYIYRSL